MSECNCQNCREPIKTNYEEKLKILALGKKMAEYKKIVQDDVAKNGEPSDEKIASEQEVLFAQYFKDCGFTKGNEREERIFHEVVCECLFAFSLGMDMNLEKTEEKIANERQNLN